MTVRQKSIFFLSIISMVLLISCNSGLQEEARESTPTREGVAVFSRQQLDLAGIRFGHIKAALISRDIHAPGHLVLHHHNETTASSMTEGLVTDISVHKGDAVRKGQSLCQLMHPEIINIQEDYLGAKYQYDADRKQYERSKELLENNVSSQKSFQRAEAAYLRSKASYDALKLKVQMLNIDFARLDTGVITDRANVLSPIDGKVDEIYVSLGAYAGIGMGLFKIIDKGELHVEVMVFEKDIPGLLVGQRVNFVLANLGDKVYQANIVSIGNILHKNINAVSVRASFTGDTRDLYPGMFVAAVIHADEKAVEALPETAVIIKSEKDKYIFFTLSDPETDEQIVFEKIKVITGRSEEGFIGVTVVGELPAGALVVTDGGYYIKSEMMKELE